MKMFLEEDLGLSSVENEHAPAIQSEGKGM